MGIRVVGIHSGATEKDLPVEIMAQYANTERDCMKRVAHPDTEIVMRFPYWGIRGPDGFTHSLTNRLNERNLYHQIVSAEKEGFDAVIVICGYDSILRELRTAVDIPVVGITEAALHTASIIGYKFGVICPVPGEMVFQLNEIVDRYGLRQKCAGVLAMTACPIAAKDPEAQMSQVIEGSIEGLKEPAGELVKQGAEIIYIA